ncbi:saccharopine dehydrogenase family protein [Natronincola ferrireducens]|uniref:Saccharopine dehydrogenase, NADP-dependent n=1 Tax=Natronincola ferrireducens TaxID=393762 RepID=A0A1G8YM50_9FIRM|nr:saccharopine dehydrogenase C-terminal domain-containing protein [Natronincola ferrireducens]SDK03851.1 Saccharopine dehydrogenase, NADP-dependent [Natronincola ferrireducens]
MKALLVGVGAVGEAIVKILSKRDTEGKWLEKMVLADYDFEKAKSISEELQNSKRFPAEFLDASDKEEIINMIKKHEVDFVLNGSPPYLNNNIFDAAFEAGVKYLDMGLYSNPYPAESSTKGYIEWMGDYSFKKAKEWEEKNLLAILGAGIDPGVADVFAKFAAKHIFDELEEIGVKDGNNITVKDLDIAFGFSIWTVIDEVLNPPVVWERDKGWYTVEPFSGIETFDFPEGIGPQKLINCEHEEVVFIPKYIDKGLKKVSFKIGLGDEMIQALKVIRGLGMDKKEKYIVDGVEVSPRDVVASIAPSPAELRDKMEGKMCVGIHVKGKKDGKKREIFMYQYLDHKDAMERVGCQVVVTQTAFGACIATELVAKEIWQGKGVHCPEYFEPEPFLKLMQEYEYPFRILEMDSEYKKSRDEFELNQILDEVAISKE